MIKRTVFLIIISIVFSACSFFQKKPVEKEASITETIINNKDSKSTSDLNETIKDAISLIEEGNTAKAMELLTTIISKTSSTTEKSKSVEMLEFLKIIEKREQIAKKLAEEGRLTEAKKEFESVLYSFLEFTPQDINSQKILAEKFLAVYVEYSAIEEAELEKFAEGADEKIFEEEFVKPILLGIPITVNKRLIAFFERFREENATELFLLQLKRGMPYKEYIETELKKVGLPEEFFYLAFQESVFNIYAKSPHPWDCRGIWQFKDTTFLSVIKSMREAKDETGNYLYPELKQIANLIVKIDGNKDSELVDYRFDPIIATKAAAFHLKDLYNNWTRYVINFAAENGLKITETEVKSLVFPLVMASYNRGETNIKRDLEYYAKKHGKRDFSSLVFFKVFTYSDEDRYKGMSQSKKQILQSALKQNVDYVYLIYARMIYGKNILLNSPKLLETMADIIPEYDITVERKTVETDKNTNFWLLSGESLEITEKLLKMNPAFVSGFVPEKGVFFISDSVDITQKSKIKMNDIIFREKITSLEKKMISKQIVAEVFNILNRKRNSIYFFHLVKPASFSNSAIVCANNYKVRQGDSFWKIADNNGMSLSMLINLNPNILPDKLKENDVICISKQSACEKNYVVKKGDTLSGIASDFSVSLSELLDSNEGVSGYLIPGKTSICIPFSKSEVNEIKAESVLDEQKNKTEEKKGSSIQEKKIATKDLPILKERKPTTPEDIKFAILWNRDVLNIMLDPLIPFEKKVSKIKSRNCYIPEKGSKTARLIIKEGMTPAFLQNMGIKQLENSRLIAGKETAVTYYSKVIYIKITSQDIEFIESKGFDAFMGIIQKSLGLTKRTVDNILKKDARLISKGFVITIEESH